MKNILIALSIMFSSILQASEIIEASEGLKETLNRAVEDAVWENGLSSIVDSRPFGLLTVQPDPEIEDPSLLFKTLKISGKFMELIKELRLLYDNIPMKIVSDLGSEKAYWSLQKKCVYMVPEGVCCSLIFELCNAANSALFEENYDLMMGYAKTPNEFAFLLEVAECMTSQRSCLISFDFWDVLMRPDHRALRKYMAQLYGVGPGEFEEFEEFMEYNKEELLEKKENTFLDYWTIQNMGAYKDITHTNAIRRQFLTLKPHYSSCTENRNFLSLISPQFEEAIVNALMLLSLNRQFYVLKNFGGVPVDLHPSRKTSSQLWRGA